MCCMIVMFQLQSRLPSFIICWKSVQKSNFQTRPCWTLSWENIGPMIVLYRSVHPIPVLISWRGCWCTWCGFRELYWLVIWELTERLSAVKLYHLDITLLFLKTSPPTYLGRKLQKLNLRPLLFFYLYSPVDSKYTEYCFGYHKVL